MGPRRIVARSATSLLAVAALLLIASCATSPGRGDQNAVEPDEPTESVETPVDPAAAIVGVWKAPEPANQDAFAEFTDFGLWFASDGCNQTGAGYRVGSDGSFESFGSSALTAVGCDNEDIPLAVGGAVSVDFDEKGRLVLKNTEGESTALVRASASAASLVGSWAGPGSAKDLSRVDFAEDGTWRGLWGCHEFGGTWSLEVRDDLLFDPHVAGVPSVVLSIGPADPMAICMDDSAPEFPLAPDTEYWFDMRHDVFWIYPVEGADPLAVAAPAFYRLAAEIGVR